jgi:hypothetical protein
MITAGIVKNWIILFLSGEASKATQSVKEFFRTGKPIARWGRKAKGL